MATPRMIFVNVTVSDLDRSMAFFTALGMEFNPSFTNDECACMVVSDMGYVMLQTNESIRRFTDKELVDSHVATEAILCLSAESREDVDAFADRALAAGGAPAGPAQDHGFMYGRSFQDPDGHLWEVMWMDPAAVEAGPEEFAAAQ
ncbi:MAG: VOC family protein [Solirubrobacteraceae bacterium]|nr:VOC family protein [Solirubrobacteraceae bacterium]